MTLRARLALGFVTIALLLAVPLAAAHYALRDARTAVRAIRDSAFSAAQVITRLRAATDRVRRSEGYVYAEKAKPERVEEYRRDLASLTMLADSLRAYKLTALEMKTRATARDLATLAEVEIAALLDGRDDIAEKISLDQVLPTIEAVNREIEATDKNLRDAAAREVDDAVAATESAETLSLLLIAMALAASAAVAIWITRSISRPVRDLERGMEVVAGGNFAHHLTIGPGRDDEFGRLAASFQSMTDQLAELDKLKAEFMSVASHELKTPINVIMGYLKLLEENLYGPLNPRQGEVVGIMQAQSESLARLVQHLLDVSRFQAGAARLDAMPMTLRGFLTQLEATYEVLAMQRGISFSVVAAEGLPEVVTWDIDRINEVLGNLLSNAFKFTESGGRVDLVVSSLEDFVYVEVRDTGVGIAAEQMPHIFDKFFQADNQKHAGDKGSGLGLAISKEIVEAHGGSIAADSTVGVGTKFSIMLPIAAGALAPSSGAGPVEAQPNRDDVSSTPRSTAGATA